MSNETQKNKEIKVTNLYFEMSVLSILVGLILVVTHEINVNSTPDQPTKSEVCPQTNLLRWTMFTYPDVEYLCYNGEITKDTVLCCLSPRLDIHFSFKGESDDCRCLDSTAKYQQVRDELIKQNVERQNNPFYLVVGIVIASMGFIRLIMGLHQ